MPDPCLQHRDVGTCCRWLDLCGRALAGVSGNERARILCSSLEAELVSVAGLWLVRDNLPDDLIGRPAQVFLEDERLRVAPLP